MVADLPAIEDCDVLSRLADRALARLRQDYRGAPPGVGRRLAERVFFLAEGGWR